MFVKKLLVNNFRAIQVKHFDCSVENSTSTFSTRYFFSYVFNFFNLTVIIELITNVVNYSRPISLSSRINNCTISLSIEAIIGP